MTVPQDPVNPEPSNGPEPGQPAYPYQQPEYGQPGYPPEYGEPAYGQPPYGQGYPPPAPGYGTGYPPPGPGYQPYYPPNPNAKSKIAAGLLGIFLGAFGVHNFYLGRTGPAVAQLLITVLSLGFLGFVSGIWGLIEGIMILTAKPGTSWAYDAHGFPLE
ncbi:MAG: TM2 domain-containing protein [Bifidobacteriaceae bacterium]|jgi:TM2 domain-containing membrane protein YozV|nr:TM2 domain-containing protein [Bifidobacteriaceae bacterium]